MGGEGEGVEGGVWEDGLEMSCGLGLWDLEDGVRDADVWVLGMEVVRDKVARAYDVMGIRADAKPVSDRRGP